jgi:hypothetical protein
MYYPTKTDTFLPRYNTTTLSDRTQYVKQSHYSPWQALRVPAGWGSQILRQSTHEGDKVVRPSHRTPLPPRNIPGTVRGWVDPRAIVQPEELCQLKNPVTPSGIEPVTFRFVAQCLNHYATACTELNGKHRYNSICFFCGIVWHTICVRCLATLLQYIGC